MPLVRYRTGDITTLNLEPCACGHTSARMARIKGRSDDMLVVRGVNLYLSEVETTGFDAQHFEIVTLRQRAGAQLQRAIGLSVEPTIVAPRTIPRTEGKAVRVVERG